jgi:peroxiredoxin Q/BCP
MQPVKEGSYIPEFTLPDQNGRLFDIKSILGKKKLIIYFYPKDHSSGCTKEACSFRDQYEDFKDAGAEVVGISSDDIESHNKFAAKHRLNFTLLSDQNGVVRKLFGVPTNFLGLIEGRVTYVVNKKGIVIHIFNSLWQASKHIEKALEALKER